jgi:hypothetical protein
VKKNFVHLTTFVFAVVIFGCADGGCTQTVYAGEPGSTVTYVHSDGTTYYSVTDANGNVTVPCGTQDSVALIPVLPPQE